MASKICLLALLGLLAPMAVMSQANKADPIKGLTGLFAKFTPVAATVPKITDSKCASMKSKNVWTPFAQKFKDPPAAQVKATHCDENNRCVDYFEVTARLTEVQVAQTGAKTVWYGFEGSIPGPTIQVCKGRQSIVKIANNITAGVSMSTHLHGAATLSPWDGWAEDETEYGKAKFYRYPNNRAATLWYHDHDIHHTAHNAYFGEFLLLYMFGCLFVIVWLFVCYCLFVCLLLFVCCCCLFVCLFVIVCLLLFVCLFVLLNRIKCSSYSKFA